VQGGVYQIRNTVTGSKYIGSAVDFARRRRTHFWLLRRGRHHSVHLQRSYDKHGIQAFVFEPLVVCAPDYALDVERQLLTRGEGRYNVARDSTAPMRGRQHGPEAREKMSRARTGVKRPAQSAWLRELWQTPEYRERRVSVFRRPKSAEHRAKIGAAHRGRVITAEQREAIRQSVRALHADPEYAARNASSLVKARAAMAAKVAARKAAHGNP
jgi:group I intron endonuclease